MGPALSLGLLCKVMIICLLLSSFALVLRQLMHGALLKIIYEYCDNKR